MYGNYEQHEFEKSLMKWYMQWSNLTKLTFLYGYQMCLEYKFKKYKC
jgi:hypothetical protein